MKKGYVSALAVAAAVLLVGGTLIRPKPARRPSETPVPAATPPPSRRGQMRQISDFLSERGSDVSRHVTWVSASQTSGVVWPDARVVTIAPAPALVTAGPLSTDMRLQPASLAPPARFGQGGWIVVAARTAESEAIAASGILGSVANASCGSVSVRKLVFNVPLDASFAGGGIFDLSGDLLGMVVHCGDTWTAVTYQTVETLLSQQKGAEAVAWHEFGVHVRPPSDAERHVMHLPQRGLFVTETRKNSRAFNIGLRPGDLLLRTGADPLEQTEDLLTLEEDLTIVRQGRTLKLSVAPAYTLDIPNAGAVLTSVQPETRLHAAGLRAGDRIIRASGTEDPGPTDLNRLLASNRPAWLVYEREDRRVWVLLP